MELRKSLINIYSIEIVELSMPNLRIRVECSKGTYIRSLASEIGEGPGAYLEGGGRTRSGEFRVEDGWQLDDF